MMNNFKDDIIEVSSASVRESKPTVSVLMITYNHEAFLRQAVSAVAAQEANFAIELLIGEDCSTDNTRQIALGLQDRYPNLIRIIFSKSNVGANRNLARILSACRGKYIAYCDGDDYWTDHKKLQQQVEFLEANPEYVVTYHDSAVVSSDGQLIESSMFRSIDERSLDFSSRELIMFKYMPTATLVFRNVISELPPEYFFVTNGDAFLISMLGNYGKAKFISSIAPAVYRTHRGGIWSGISQQQRNIKLAESYYWIANYYNRTRCFDIASEWACVSMWHIATSIKMNKLVFLRWSIVRWIEWVLEGFRRNRRLSVGSKQ